MRWYVADAVDKAYSRTKKCLFEPFDFWKWMKLMVIVLLIGGAGSGYNGGGNNFSPDDSDQYGSTMMDGLNEGIASIDGSISDLIASDSSMIFALGILIFVVVLILLFAYISSIMEFVLVESLRTNNVKFWEYSRKYMRKGLGLLVLRLLLAIIVLFIIAIAVLPIALPLMNMSPDTATFAGALISFLFLLVLIILLIAIIMSMVNSFINLSIPVSIVTDSGIFRSLLNVLGQFKREWKQIILYWFGRMIIGIVTGIAAFIVALIALLITGIVFAIIDLIIYFVLSAIAGSESLVWIVLIPIVLVQIFLMILIVSFVTLPAPVFLKYHMLTFLEQWYPEIELDMFDDQQMETEEIVAENLVLEEKIPDEIIPEETEIIFKDENE
ncbi:hypothetical protein HNV12_20190 [Methanococcoides sp. SA1]|nr:hypothetical protein [Methanococcoides sp. SA1]